jgi:hypothetical protein
MHSVAVKTMKPVSEKPVQAFYTDKFQLFDVMQDYLMQDYLLEQTQSEE